MGHMLNNYWAGGLHLLNDHLGVLIKFRENNFAMIGDIKKMSHTVNIKTIEQHTHIFMERYGHWKTNRHVCNTKGLIWKQALRDDRYRCIAKNSRNGGG